MKIITAIFIFLSTNLFAFDINSANEYFKNCNQILENTNFRSCYNYNYKGITASYTHLYSEDIDKSNISQRPGFYEDTRIPQRYRVKNIEYYYKGFDKGHVQSDANNDYNYDILKETYALSNAVPMYPKTNRRSFLYVEKRERELTRQYKDIEVLTLIYYNNMVIENLIIPSEFIKIFFRSDIGFIECYKTKNDNNEYILEEMKIECNF